MPTEIDELERKEFSEETLLACKKLDGALEKWVLNSGAGNHMCKDESMIVGAKPVSQAIFVADTSEIPVVAIGNVEIDVDVDGECYSLHVSNALCVPNLDVNILTMSHICKKGRIQERGRCLLFDGKLDK